MSTPTLPSSPGTADDAGPDDARPDDAAGDATPAGPAEVASVDHAASQAERGSTEAQRRLLDRVAEAGLDMAAARAELARRRRLRRHGHRILAGCSALILVALVATTLALLPDPEPEQVAADQDESAERSTTTIAEATIPSAVVAEPSVPTSSIVVPTTSVLATTTAPVTVVETIPPTTVAPNQQLGAQLQLRTPRVEAGGLVELAVTWLDPDLAAGAGGSPRYTVDWGDPLVSTAADPGPQTPCDVPGAAASGTDVLRFRYATPGTHAVRVRLETCGGQGVYGDRLELTTSVEVGAATYRDPAVPDDPGRPGRSIVVFRPMLPGAAAPPSLDAAVAQFVPGADPSNAVTLAQGDAVVQFTSSGPARVVIVPVDVSGIVRLRWVDPAFCLATADGSIGTPAVSGTTGSTTSTAPAGSPASNGSTTDSSPLSLPLSVSC